MNFKEQEKQKAIEMLRKFFKPGDTVYTSLRHVSRSGMFRLIDVISINDNRPSDLSGLVAKAVGLSQDGKTGSLRVGGCGMDMGFSVAYSLSRALYGDSFVCIGHKRHCPSNDHFNGDRNYRRHKHSDGGYALRHSWI